MLLSLLKAARESIRLAQKKRAHILRSQSVKKLSLFDGEDPPSEILRDFRRKERSDSYPLRTAQSAPQRAYPRTSVSAVCGRMERRRDGKCIFAVFRRPDASGGLKGRGQCEALRSPGTPGTPLPWPVRKSGGPTRSGGLKGRGQCEALRSPGTPGTPLPWPVRKSGGPTRSGGLKGRGQCEALRNPGTPGTPLPWPVRRRMSSKTIENERACGPLKLSQGLFRQAESASPALFPRLRYAARRSVLSVSAVPLIFACVQLFQAGEGGRKTSA